MIASTTAKRFEGLGFLVLFSLLAHSGRGADTPAANLNSASVDDEGRTHLIRVIPVPKTISPEAQEKSIHPQPSILASGASISEQRAKMDARQMKDAEGCREVYPAKISDESIAGVSVRIVTPVEADAGKADRVLINIHGGGFRVDAGSLLESIPIASLTKTRVVSVLYRLSPEHAFPDGMKDAIAVYKELLKTYSPKKIAIFGTSAGAILTAETAAKIKQLGLPLPAALGIFSGSGDMSKPTDSMALFTIQGLTGNSQPPPPGAWLPDYVGKTNPSDPVLSPIFGDLKGLPPTLFLTSTRDMLLSGTVILHQAFLSAGVDARLSVFEALPHAFWLDFHLPESRTANAMIARFLDEHLN